MPCLCLNHALFVPFLILHCAVAPKPCLSLKIELVHMHGVTLVYTSSMHQANYKLHDKATSTESGLLYLAVQCFDHIMCLQYFKCIHYWFSLQRVCIP